jgi:hypothetical protein
VELVKVETGELLAQLYPSWRVVDVHEHKIGRLVIQYEGKNMMDTIVTTALVVQERSDEERSDEVRQAVNSMSSISNSY